MATVRQEVLEQIIQRIVEVAQPERVILFGSAARGDMGPHSDVDLLVVKSGEFDQSRLMEDIYLHLHGVGQAVDADWQVWCSELPWQCQAGLPEAHVVSLCIDVRDRRIPLRS
jgi:predicted nucleotidyltransferase